MSRYRKITASALWMLALMTASPASAVVKHDESIDGDISGNRLSPTQVSLAAGVNSVLATTASGATNDLEYLRVDLPAGGQLDAIILTDYEGFDLTAFIGVQSGTTFTFDADDAFGNIPNLLGYAHFGPFSGVGYDDSDGLGGDFLQPMGEAGGAIGFTGSLSGSSYTFWLQQTGATSTYQLDFVVSVVPEPASIGMMIVAGGSIIAATRHIRRREARQ